MTHTRNDVLRSKSCHYANSIDRLKVLHTYITYIYPFTFKFDSYGAFLA